MTLYKACDICHQPMEPVLGRGLTTTICAGKARIDLTISVIVDRRLNCPDVCKYCIIDAVKALDDREECKEQSDE